MMMNEVGDKELLEATVEEIGAAIAEPLARAWMLSPHATLLAVARLLAALALRQVQERPAARDSILAMLRSINDCVEAQTATRH